MDKREKEIYKSIRAIDREREVNWRNISEESVDFCNFIIFTNPYLLCWNGVVALDGVRLAVCHYDRSVHLWLRSVRDGGSFRGRLERDASGSN